MSHKASIVILGSIAIVSLIVSAILLKLDRAPELGIAFSRFAMFLGIAILIFTILKP